MTFGGGAATGSPVATFYILKKAFGNPLISCSDALNYPLAPSFSPIMGERMVAAAPIQLSPLSQNWERGGGEGLMPLPHYLQVKGSIGLSRAFFSLFRVIFDPSANETGHKTMYLLQELVCFIFKAGRRASMIAKINGFEHKKLVIDRISVRLTCDQCPYRNAFRNDQKMING
jgi:hypothetical protein